MAIEWVRIDDRLIHGQVATSWLSHIKVEQVICVSDRAAQSPIQKQVLQMAAPNLSVHVFSVEKFIDIINSVSIKKSTFVITESTSDVLRLVSGGLDITEVNFGGMRSGEGRVQYAPELCFTDQEMKAIHELISKGIDINYQIAPYQEPLPLLDVIKDQVKEGSIHEA